MNYPKKVFVPLGALNPKVAATESEKTQLQGEGLGVKGWQEAEQIEGETYMATHTEGTAENPNAWTVYTFFSLSNQPHLRVIHSANAKILTDKLKSSPRAWKPQYDEYLKWRPGNNTATPFPFHPNPLGFGPSLQKVSL